MVKELGFIVLPEKRLDMERIRMEEQRLLLTVRIVTDETFSCHKGFDLATFEERSPPLPDLPTFHVLKQETYSVFKSRVAQRFGYPESRIRLWALVNRQNRTVRPDTYILENEPSSSMLC